MTPVWPSVLQLDRNTCTAEQLKEQYRNLCKQHHPDMGGDTGRFQEIQQAYQEALNEVKE